jgi:protein-glucosylgalactosylhydroxylysine glucosidase
MPVQYIRNFFVVFEQNYLGHVFWDQETWMYPPVLLMHAELSWMLLETRYRTIAAALNNANMTGYRGLRYPWESAVTG